MTGPSRIVVLNGLRRGGTSIVWNILESHPGACSPIEETGQILYREVLPWLPELPSKLVLRTALSSGWIPEGVVRRLDDAVKRALWTQRLRNLDDPDNRYKYEDVPYSRDEIESALLCLKSVNRDTALTGYFDRCFPDARFIGLIRNGYAILEGALRRGDSAEKVGRDYRRVGRRLIRDARERSNYLLVKFEDVLADPFAAASRLYAFAGLEPTRLDKLRLKSKRVLSKDGSHAVRFGEEDRKYWFDREQIWSILDRDVDRTQARRLSPGDLRKFERIASDVLEHFGYSVEG